MFLMLINDLLVPNMASHERFPVATAEKLRSDSLRGCEESQSSSDRSPPRSRDGAIQQARHPKGEPPNDPTTWGGLSYEPAG